MPSILITGGKGKLGQELQKKIEGTFLGHEELDVTNKVSVEKIIESYDIVIHLAADTNLQRCEKDKQRALIQNVLATNNIKEVCKKIGSILVYPSTDYVFDGNKGMYKENDKVNPVNFYSMTKYYGEMIVRQYPNHLILRGTMKERGKWRHPFAPIDMYESLLHHDEYADMMVELLERKARGTFHLGKGRFSVYEWAKKFDKDVQPKTLDEIGFPLPKDCSLDTTKYDNFIKKKRQILDIRKKVQ